jgi:hydrogenase maturation protease
LSEMQARFSIPDTRCSPTSFEQPKSGHKAQRILVLGLGNILLKDEGVGAHVAQRLQQRSLPGSVEIVDAGTAALDVLLLAEGIERLVIIDAMRAGGKPGTIYVAHIPAGQTSQLAQIFPGQDGSKISLHQAGLLDALAAAKAIGRAPEQIVIVGVEPAEVDCGLELTDEVERRIPEIIDTVLKEIKDDIHAE